MSGLQQLNDVYAAPLRSLEHTLGGRCLNKVKKIAFSQLRKEALNITPLIPF
jgi:hypothetical protein